MDERKWISSQKRDETVGEGEENQNWNRTTPDIIKQFHKQAYFKSKMWEFILYLTNIISGDSFIKANTTFTYTVIF